MLPLPGFATFLPGIGDFTGSSAGASNGTLGFRFRATMATSVLGLAVWDRNNDGFSGNTVDVGLWSDAGALLGQVQVASSDPTIAVTGGLSGSYRYDFLSSPIALTVGSYYRVGADMSDIPEAGEYIIGAVPTDLNYIDDISRALSGSFNFPSITTDPGQAYLGGNILLEVPQDVPVPPSALLLAVGIGGFLALRKPKRRA
jgi:hypothetical protein